MWDDYYNKLDFAECGKSQILGHPDGSRNNSIFSLMNYDIHFIILVQ